MQQKIKDLEKLSKPGSFFIISAVINGRHRGKIKDVAIYQQMDRNEESEKFEA